MDINYSEKKTKTVKSYVIPIDIYKCSINVLFYDENEKLEKNEEWKEHGFAAMIQNYLTENRDVVLRFAQKRPTVSTLSHEATHIAEAIMKHIGHDKIGEGTEDEPLAYLQGYVVQEVLKLAKKHGVRFKLE